MTKTVRGRATRGVECRFRLNLQVKRGEGKGKLSIGSKTQLYPHIFNVSLRWLMSG